MSASEDTSFPRLVSLACHDLRTPLATVSGFAKTLTRLESVDEKTARYLGMIDVASGQLADLLETLSLAARIAGGRYDAEPREVDTLELAQAGAARSEGARVEGSGGAVRVDVDATERALGAFAECLRRHGPVEAVTLAASGTEIRLSPVKAAAARVALGDELRDLGSFVGRMLVESLGGSVVVEDETLVVRLPQ
jgi:signal transduction histidine kinase